MFSLLLAIIYLSFISLGLPDSLLGSAWPIMYEEFGVSISYAGIISMIISAGTIISSLFSDKLTCKIGTGLITAISVMITAVALFGFSISKYFIILCLFAIPYGLGAGAVDAAINNYVALHYSSKHMSWLHCFWGVGASISPYIMGFAIGKGYGWKMGYGIVSTIQIFLTIILFISLPVWKKNNFKIVEGENCEVSLGILDAIRLKGVKPILFAFFCYCAFESTVGLWASSYLVEFKEINTQIAAMFASLYYIGITIGRFISGFLSEKFGDKKMIRLGASIILLGLVLIIFPTKIDFISLVGFIIVGLGCAPIYPAIIHSTPNNFGKENSHTIVGIEMAFAYTGSTFMPPFFGLITKIFNISIFPFYILVFLIIMFLTTEVVNIYVK